MQFVQNDKTWHGFQRMTPSAPMGSFLVVCWFDGEPEIWNVESYQGLASLRLYYRMDWGLRDIPMTISVIQERGNTREGA